MLRPKSRVSAVTPKIILLLLSYLFLVSAAIYRLVGSYRVDVLRTDLAKVNDARDAAEHRETQFKTREAAVAGAQTTLGQPENTATKEQTELLTRQHEQAQLE